MAAEIWYPEPLFWGQRVFILGGGPSLKFEDVEFLGHVCRENVIVINDRIKLAPWGRILFFRDLDWFYGNKLEILEFEGEVVTIHPEPARLCHTIRRIKVEHVDEFRSIGADSIKYGRTSGHLALSLAITMGAREVVLMGFDGHSEEQKELYEFDFLKYWNGWGELVKRAGVEVINTTPKSSIKEFPHMTFDEMFK